MINRIRDIRRQKGLTLADLAAACSPPTTAQTIGRLETGTRNLSLKWMEKIGAALGVDPETLVRSETTASIPVVATLMSGWLLLYVSTRSETYAIALGISSSSFCGKDRKY